MNESVGTIVLEVEKPEPQIVPKEKRRDLEIQIRVMFPDGEHSFIFVKQSILSHLTPNRLTRNEFKNMFERGFVPLLGELSERARGG